MVVKSAVTAGLVFAAVLSGCSDAEPEAAPPAEVFAAADAVTDPEIEALTVAVVRSVPHDPSGFTQGLVLDGDGNLYESTGHYGQSSLQQVDPESGQVLERVKVDAEYFAEGLALVGERLIQLTWKEEVALVYDKSTLEQVATFDYQGEGWGLCLDDDRLVMSDGSPRLTFRDPSSFEETGAVEVTLAGEPLKDLNELECVNGVVWANVWQTDTIVRIDPSSGVVTGVVDASGLLTGPERRAADVLNGIAWDPETETFWITGKFWPARFQVTFDTATP